MGKRRRERLDHQRRLLRVVFARKQSGVAQAQIAIPFALRQMLKTAAAAKAQGEPAAAQCRQWLLKPLRKPLRIGGLEGEVRVERGIDVRYRGKVQLAAALELVPFD